LCGSSEMPRSICQLQGCPDNRAMHIHERSNERNSAMGGVPPPVALPDPVPDEPSGERKDAQSKTSKPRSNKTVSSGAVGVPSLDLSSLAATGWEEKVRQWIAKDVAPSKDTGKEGAGGGTKLPGIVHPSVSSGARERRRGSGAGGAVTERDGRRRNYTLSQQDHYSHHKSSPARVVHVAPPPMVLTARDTKRSRATLTTSRSVRYPSVFEEFKPSYFLHNLRTTRLWGTHGPPE